NNQTATIEATASQPKFKPAAYTVEEAATILRMSVKSVRRQIERGNLRRCGQRRLKVTGDDYQFSGGLG
ncbi:MAG TPA: helix-turn-helix domain-containing protein, partial [Candidatus Sulfotelmatobacter sp.]|nr:helix-turn-helix domain-containing protein [Candidatus Sulfotelmatobacter sp.]